MIGGTRFVEMELFSGASLNNFYWMEGPLPGDNGCRITVLHPGQLQQCSHCLKQGNLGCPGKGNGRACLALGTQRTKMNVYMDFVKIKHGYRSLKAKYFEQFPSLGGAGTCGLDMVERDETADDNIVPVNPIEEKDSEIAELKNALEKLKEEANDSRTVKENLTKNRNELRIANRTALLSTSKIDFARKVTEQRMSNCISDSCLEGEVEDELVALYATLADEDNFEMDEDNILSAKKDFLIDLKNKIVERGEKPEEKLLLESVKYKILEKVKSNMSARKSRRDSVGSNHGRDSSSSLKRSSSDHSEGDRSRSKTEIQA